MGRLSGPSIDIEIRHSGSTRSPGDLEYEHIRKNSEMLHLLQDIGNKVGSVPKLEQLVKQITHMTQHAFNASASSLLLLDETEQELIFEIAEGQSAKALRRIRLNIQSGIAGWVIRNCSPLIVNDVTKDERFNNSIDEISGFVTRSIICVPLIAHRKPIGVIEVINKVDGSEFTEYDLAGLVSVASTAAIAIENTRLNQSLLNSYKSTIKALAAAIDAKDPYTRGHSQRVMEYALLGGSYLSLSEKELEVLEYAGILHDIGKIGVANHILTKPGALTRDEWKAMRRHSAIGEIILKDIPFLEQSRALIRSHHERYDGTGYPDGLKGEEIPIGARLLAVADAFDTMTTNRSYRSARSIEYAIEELYTCAGTQFCSTAVNAFVSGYNMKMNKSRHRKYVSH